MQAAKPQLDVEQVEAVVAFAAVAVMQRRAMSRVRMTYKRLRKKKTILTPS